MQQALTLYELNSLVREVIEGTLNDLYWVTAEVSEVREVRGHCYIELVQKDMLGATPVAKASAKCWKNTWFSLKTKFIKYTGQDLSRGMQVMLQVRANFHEAYGFSWIVYNINPAYTLGDMARKRQEIIDRLKEEGVFDMQHSFSLPAFCQRVAVISSNNAAGYGDFCNQLDNNAYGLVFYTRLFEAVMQGENVTPTIIEALNRINQQAEHFDVVVIIRGGGATSDMAGFDTLPLAENIANFPLPIITGIGHERDQSVADMVAWQRVKTPTAAAALLIEHLNGTYQNVQNCADVIIKGVSQLIDRQKLLLKNITNSLPMQCMLLCEKQRSKLNTLQHLLATNALNSVSRRQLQLKATESRLTPAATALLKACSTRLQLMQQRIESMDPKLLLNRGYSITLHNGHAITSASELKPGAQITTQLAKGKITSIVK